MEIGKSKLCSVGQEAGDTRQLMVQMKSEGSLLENSPASVICESHGGDSNVNEHGNLPL